MVTEEKFIALYVRHESELRAFARSLTLHRDDALDVLQEACVAMWRKIGTLENELAFRRWAYSYVRLTAMNHLRKKQRSPLQFTNETIEIIAGEWEEEGELAAAERQALAECLGKLTEKQSRLIALYYASPNTTVEDIGARLKRPMAGIYKALARCRATLRDCVTAKIQTAGLS